MDKNLAVKLSLKGLHHGYSIECSSAIIVCAWIVNFLEPLRDKVTKISEQLVCRKCTTGYEKFGKAFCHKRSISRLCKTGPCHNHSAMSAFQVHLVTQGDDCSKLQKQNTKQSALFSSSGILIVGSVDTLSPGYLSHKTCR